MRFAACNDPARRAPTPPEPTAAPAIIIPVIPQAEWNFSQAKRWSVRAKLLPPTKGGEIWVVGPTYNSPCGGRSGPANDLHITHICNGEAQRGPLLSGKETSSMGPDLAPIRGDGDSAF